MLGDKDAGEGVGKTAVAMDSGILATDITGADGRMASAYGNGVLETDMTGQKLTAGVDATELVTVTEQGGCILVVGIADELEVTLTGNLDHAGAVLLSSCVVATAETAKDGAASAAI